MIETDTDVSSITLETDLSLLGVYDARGRGVDSIY